MNQKPSGHQAIDANQRLRVVCVDDEPQVLSGLSLHLRKRYDVEVATSGAAGLELLAKGTQAAVVISDMRMPGMSGAEFLAKVRKLSPDTSRILLTGHAEVDSAIAAVNEGQVFRFLTKPCPPPALLSAVQAAAELYRMATAERVLLSETLHGCVQTLIDVLSITNPVSFGRATRIKGHVTDLSNKLDLPDRWQVEVAAMLSQIGTITLPVETAEKLYYGTELSSEEEKMVSSVPAVTERLLSHIPRLEGVRSILGGYNAAFRKSETEGDPVKVALYRAAQVLKVAADFDSLEAHGNGGKLALETLKGRAERYDPQVLQALTELQGRETERLVVREVSMAALRTGMTFAEDVKFTTGTLLVARGYEITPNFLERVRNFRPGTVKEPVRVIVKPRSWWPGSS